VIFPTVLALGAGLALVVRRPEAGLAIAIAVSPLTNLRVDLSTPAFTVPSKPFQILLPVAVFALLVYGAVVSRERLRASRALTVSLAIFLVVGLVSSIQALQPADSIKKVVILATGFALYLAVLQLCRDVSKLTVVVAGALGALLVAGGQGVLERLRGDPSRYGFLYDGSVVERIQGSLGHPNQYGGFIAFLIPLAVAVLWTREFTRAMRLLALAALAVGVPALALSYARGAIGALVIGSLAWLLLFHPKRALVAGAVVAIAVVAFAPAALKERFDPGQSSGDLPLRADIWGAAVDIYGQHPLLGVGLNNFGDAYESLPASLANASQRRLLHQEQLLVPPHAQNLYLNVLAELGIVGLAVFGMLAVSALAVAYKGSQSPDLRTRAVCLGTGAALLTLGAHSVLEVTLFGEVAFPLFALLAVCAAMTAGPSANPEAEGDWASPASPPRFRPWRSASERSASGSP
jgi:O-antigen ligase